MTGIKRIEGCNFDSMNNEILLFTDNEMIHARFKPCDNSFVIHDTKTTDSSVIYSRIDNQGRLITVDKATNNLTA